MSSLLVIKEPSSMTSSLRGEHDFYVDKANGQLLRLERPCGEQFAKVSRGYCFRAFGTTCE